MSLNWIKITERAREGIKIINSLDFKVYSTVLDYVFKHMNPEDDHDEPEDQLEQLEKLVNLDNRSDFLLLIKTMSYILKRTSIIIIKPTKLQAELREKLKISDEKVDAIIKLWIKTTKPILDNLELKKIEETELDDVAWKLRMQLGSSYQQKEKTLLGLLQLIPLEGPPTNLVMNHDELAAFYNQIENIQNELDALRSK